MALSLSAEPRAQQQGPVLSSKDGQGSFDEHSGQAQTLGLDLTSQNTLWTNNAPGVTEQTPQALQPWLVG